MLWSEEVRTPPEHPRLSEIGVYKEAGRTKRSTLLPDPSTEPDPLKSEWSRELSHRREISAISESRFLDKSCRKYEWSRELSHRREISTLPQHFAFHHTETTSRRGGVSSAPAERSRRWSNSVLRSKPGVLGDDCHPGGRALSASIERSRGSRRHLLGDPY